MDYLNQIVFNPLCGFAYNKTKRPSRFHIHRFKHVKTIGSWKYSECRCGKRQALRFMRGISSCDVKWMATGEWTSREDIQLLSPPPSPPLRTIRGPINITHGNVTIRDSFFDSRIEPLVENEDGSVSIGVRKPDTNKT